MKKSRFPGYILGLCATAFVALAGCSDDDEGCLTEDCGGTYCDTDADCPSPRVCTGKRGGVVETGIPIGCVVPEGAGG